MTGKFHIQSKAEKCTDEHHDSQYAYGSERHNRNGMNNVDSNKKLRAKQNTMSKLLADLMVDGLGLFGAKQPDHST